MTKTCSEEDCERKHYAKGMCHNHYMRDRRKTNPRKCSVDGCDRGHESQGYCGGHYARLKATGDVQADVPLRRRDPERVCDHPGCARPMRAGGLCEAHYSRKKHGRDMDAPIKERTRHTEPQCYRPGCKNPPVKTGYCAAHISRGLGLLYKYNLTWDDFDRMYREQGGRCAICQTELLEDSPDISIDHCHTEGHVRGLLCALCNVGLGSFQDDPERLRAAIAYLAI